ncbi:hypothetical protein BGX38DRAFT_1196604, partial [Terfezia claveryi]
MVCLAYHFRSQCTVLLHVFLLTKLKNLLFFPLVCLTSLFIPFVVVYAYVLFDLQSCLLCYVLTTLLLLEMTVCLVTHLLTLLTYLLFLC